MAHYDCSVCGGAMHQCEREDTYEVKLDVTLKIRVKAKDAVQAEARAVQQAVSGCNNPTYPHITGKIGRAKVRKI